MLLLRPGSSPRAVAFLPPPTLPPSSTPGTRQSPVRPRLCRPTVPARLRAPAVPDLWDVRLGKGRENRQGQVVQRSPRSRQRLPLLPRLLEDVTLLSRFKRDRSVTEARQKRDSVAREKCPNLSNQKDRRHLPSANLISGTKAGQGEVPQLRKQITRRHPAQCERKTRTKPGQKRDRGQGSGSATCRHPAGYQSPTSRLLVAYKPVR